MKHALALLLFCALAAGCRTETSPGPLARSATGSAEQGKTDSQVTVVHAASERVDGSAKKEVSPAALETEIVPAERPRDQTIAAPPKASDANPAATRPKADREPTRPGDPEKITFDDLILGMQADMVYRPFMLTDRAKELEGKRVRLSGDMYGGVEGSEKLKEFIVLRNKQCKYGSGGQADHVARVVMKEGHIAKYTSDSVRVEGTLRIAPENSKEDGNTNHIYILEDAIMK